MNILRLSVPAVALSLIAGCSTFLPQRNDLLAERVPDAYSETGGEAEIHPDWWTAFQSDELNRLMDEAFSGNLTIAQYSARLRQKQALAVKAGAGRLPSVSGSASAGVTRPDMTESAQIEAYSLGLNASYELDLWGRVNSTAKAAQYTAEAGRFDLQSAAMTISANIADSWLALIAQQEKVRLIEEQIETNEKVLNLLKLRQRNAQSTALDVLQQKQALSAVRALLPPAELQLGLLKSQLTVLLGRPAGSDITISTAVLPPLPARPEAGLPSDLLLNRPDIRAGLLRLEAADRSVAAAQANRLPTITLSGSLSASDSDIGDVLDNWAGNLLAGLAAPLFDAGSRKAESEYQRALAEEQVATYRETVLNAITEVNNALLTERKTAEQQQAEQLQLESVSDNYKEARLRYRNGQSTYLAVLNALTSKQSIERSLITTQLSLRSARIELYRALGGDWTDIDHF